MNNLLDRETRTQVILVLAAIFQTARIISNDANARNPKASFDDAEKFVKEVEHRFPEASRR